MAQHGTISLLHQSSSLRRLSHLLHGFALTIPSPIRVVTEDFDPKYSAKTVANASVKDQVAFLADNNMTLPTDMPSLIQRRVFVDFGLYIAIIIIALKIASELFQLSNSPFSYFQNLENLLEWFLYVTSLLFCFLSLLILIIVSRGSGRLEL
ncbi:hypothetical protein EB796_005522 [Bugula neritina]|uniref:Uncharacterized protein n=1 Tax=Bugula neritina TaxID=10212 RepID=A0A7J7KD29_BUGNE|nr:hypothetical protein EB796_005522 [Bugula neritina]